MSEALGLKVLNLDPRDHPVIKRVIARQPGGGGGAEGRR